MSVVPAVTTFDLTRSFRVGSSVVHAVSSVGISVPEARLTVVKEGVTIVMTTHDPAMQELADHVVELENGRVVSS